MLLALKLPTGSGELPMTTVHGTVQKEYIYDTAING